MKIDALVKGLKSTLGKVAPILIGGVLMLAVVAWMIGMFEPKILPPEAGDAPNVILGETVSLVIFPSK